MSSTAGMNPPRQTDPNAPDQHRCFTCGDQKGHKIQRLCPHHKSKNHYCDNWCFKWRFIDGRFIDLEQRYALPTYFGRRMSV